MPKRKTCSRPDSLLGYLRLKKGLSIEGLADEIKINPMLLWKMEQLRFTVQIRFAKRVADYYGLTLDELYNNDFSVLGRINPGSAVSESSYFKEQAALNVKKMSVGRRGELLVAQWEFKKLMPIGLHDVVNADPGLVPGQGYDVFSLTKDSKPLFIEVKTTTAGRNVPFHMTAHERDFMIDCFKRNIRYELHRVYDLNGSAQRVIYQPEDLMNFTTIPTDYVVKPE
ncbi:MAG: DUF3883 domain-containing protein [Oscillospiraceae bacterium]|nr:DUF3883 domain-containing protein [Oscillospiraceae bacterium]